MEKYYNLKPIKKWFSCTCFNYIKNNKYHKTIKDWNYNEFYKHNDKRYSIFEYNGKMIIPTNGGYYPITF